MTEAYLRKQVFKVTAVANGRRMNAMEGPFSIAYRYE
jgi:hypothetical protein